MLASKTELRSEIQAVKNDIELMGSRLTLRIYTTMGVGAIGILTAMAFLLQFMPRS